MNGTTVPASSTCGQLCTKLRFGNSVAAETMKPSSATIATWRGVHAAAARSIISSG